MNEFGTAMIEYSVIGGGNTPTSRVCLRDLPRALFDGIPASGASYEADDDDPLGGTVYYKTIRRKGVEIWFSTRERPVEPRITVGMAVLAIGDIARAGTVKDDDANRLAAVYLTAPAENGMNDDADMQTGLEGR